MRQEQSATSKRISSPSSTFGLLLIFAGTVASLAGAQMGPTSFTDGTHSASLIVSQQNQQSYTLTTTAPLRDNAPADKRRTFAEREGFPRIRTGTPMFDALYALALDDAALNAVSQIRDGSFDVRPSMNAPYFQTGEMWTYVWTRDIAYATDLGLASLDPQRCRNSLLFKTTCLKPGIDGLYSRQIVQDTGSGGSYPVSTDRIAWIFGAWEVLKYLPPEQRTQFLEDCWEVAQNTIEHDRHVIFDPSDGLYRGEQSFLDWREQTYPGWTKDNVLAIAESKALSTNIAHFELLKTASRLAGIKGLSEQRQRYAKWAADLKNAINREFYVESPGLYSSLILDGRMKVRLNRFDLLGQSLAILAGVADDRMAEKIISNYPQSQYGPPVVWPQEQSVPIYHNHAYWPFVTAYWLKAARQAGHSTAVDQAAFSLIRGAALNLSNMENFDFATGNAYADIHGISGPVINSRRQLWSVGGYIAFIQDVVFGLETDWDGIRFLPCITGGMHREYFVNSKTVVLEDFRYRGKKVQVTVHLPEVSGDGSAIYAITSISVNGSAIDNRFVPYDELRNANRWDIRLGQGVAKADRINLVNCAEPHVIFGPPQPRWKDEAIVADGKTLKLQYDLSDEANVRFNVYRDGVLCAKMIPAAQWTDSDLSDYSVRTHMYAIEAVYPDSGNASHLSPVRWYPPGRLLSVPASSMKNVGGNLVNRHHFENWGQPPHELLMTIDVSRGGCYQVCAEYSNGAGPINTGITCAVKRVDIAEPRGKVVAHSYLVMPQTADWTRYVDSSSFEVRLEEGKTYSIRLYEDEYSRNMSYFDHYEPYRGTGNGSQPYNYVNIASLNFLRIEN